MQELNNIDFKFEGNYLVAIFKNTSEILDDQLTILTSSKISGLLPAKNQIQGGIVRLLPTKKQAKNDSLRLYYDITSKLSLKQSVISGKINPHEFLNLCNKIIETCNQLKSYQLVNQGLLLDANYIYVNPESFDAEFIYLPLYAKDLPVQALTDFFRVLLFSNIIDMTDSRLIQSIVDKLDHKYTTLQQLETAIFNLKSGRTEEEPKPEIKDKKSWFGKALDKLTGKSKTSSPKTATPTPKPVNQRRPQTGSPTMQPRKEGVCVPDLSVKPEMQQQKPDDYYATMLMSKEIPSLIIPKLEHIKNGVNETIPISSSPFRIGKLPDRVHYVCENLKVSKIHAEFTFIENKVYVTDLNSLNGTYINGAEIRIQSNVPTLLNNNDRITLADEDFYLLFDERPSR